MDETALGQLFSTTTGVWALLAVVVVALFRAWPAIMERVNEARRDRASIDAGHYARMDERLKHLEKRDEECQRALTDAVRRLAEVEGYMMGQGKSRQEAANIVAVERLADSEKRDTGGNGK